MPISNCENYFRRWYLNNSLVYNGEQYIYGDLEGDYVISIETDDGH